MIYLESSNSPQDGSVIEQSNGGRSPISKYAQSTSTQKPQRTSANGASAPRKQFLQTKNKIEEPPKTTQPEMETPKSSASSLTYKTPRSSQSDTISDLDEDDIRALNKIQSTSDFFRTGEVRYRFHPYHSKLHSMQPSLQVLVSLCINSYVK